jgi:hypothetical protein
MTKNAKRSDGRKVGEDGRSPSLGNRVLGQR